MSLDPQTEARIEKLEENLKFLLDLLQGKKLPPRMSRKRFEVRKRILGFTNSQLKRRHEKTKLS